MKRYNTIAETGLQISLEQAMDTLYIMRQGLEEGSMIDGLEQEGLGKDDAIVAIATVLERYSTDGKRGELFKAREKAAYWKRKYMEEKQKHV